MHEVEANDLTLSTYQCQVIMGLTQSREALTELLLQSHSPFVHHRTLVATAGKAHYVKPNSISLNQAIAVKLMSAINTLKLAYGANIVILVPVCMAMYRPTGTIEVFRNTVPESAGLRLMVASLWTAILLASIFGLVRPDAVKLVIPLQVIYKSIWVVTFIAPKLANGNRSEVPFGIATTFLLIVLTYPVIYWYATR